MNFKIEMLLRFLLLAHHDIPLALYTSPSGTGEPMPIPSLSVKGPFSSWQSGWIISYLSFLERALYPLRETILKWFGAKRTCLTSSSIDASVSDLLWSYSWPFLVLNCRVALDRRLIPGTLLSLIMVHFDKDHAHLVLIDSFAKALELLDSEDNRFLASNRTRYNF